MENVALPKTQNKIDTIVYERWFHRILSHWHLFLMSVILGVGAAFFYLRYTKKVYTVSSSVLVKDVSQNINPFDQNVRTSEALYSRNYILTNEIKIFTSRRLVEETLNNIEWQVSYFAEGNIMNTELYKFDKFKVVYDNENNNIPYGKPIYVDFNEDNSFKLYSESLEEDGWKFKKKYQPNTPIEINGFKFTLTIPSNINLSKERYSFIINSKKATIAEFTNKLRVVQYDKTSSVLHISTQGTCIEKEIDFVNQHCNSFVKVSLNDKNQVQERTIEFIDKQLKLLADTLEALENKMILYRKKFNGSNVESIVEKKFSKLEELKEEKSKYLLNKRYFDYLYNYLTNKTEFNDIVAPSSVGVNDPLLSSLIQQLIELTLKQNTSFKIENSNSPFKIDNENKINQLKKNIIEVLANISKSNEILYQDLTKRIEEVNKIASTVLVNEKDYLDLKRRYKINEELYNKLLNKKAELAVTRAGNVSDTKIVDFAYVSAYPYPNKSKIYTIYVLISLLIPLAYVLLKYLTNYKIMDKDDIKFVLEMPFLGTIGHIHKDEKLVVINKPQSVMAESFRSIRANLSYFLPNKEQKVILITSSTSGEGKTFCSMNIAAILAVSNKKVLLVGADLRKPKVYLDIDIRDKVGLSNFLSGKSTIDQIIINTGVKNLDFIPAGSVPPNPAELLNGDRIATFFEEVKSRYDYIIVDTPPIGLVTDALPLTKYANLVVYMVRHNYTQTKYLKELADLFKTGVFPSFVYLFNDFEITKNFGYGYRYGYYKNDKEKSGYYTVDDESKSFLRKLFKV